VRRNYEMPSEAVQLMGVVAERGQASAALQRPAPAERARSRVAAARPAQELAAASPAPAPAPVASTPAPATPAPADPEPQPSDPAPLRGRLKLAPTATDAEFKAVFDTAGGRASDDTAWTWKELLTTLSGDAKVGAANEAAEGLYAEIERMGVDPVALLPKSRLDEIAAASGERGGAREVVRALAPAALRRIARRLLADARFRRHAQAFVGPFGEALAVAAKRDPRGAETTALLATDAGRAYLLLDAAAAQLGEAA
jgi:hypothetical protein